MKTENIFSIFTPTMRRITGNSEVSEKRYRTGDPGMRPRNTTLLLPNAIDESMTICNYI